MSHFDKLFDESYKDWLRDRVLYTVLIVFIAVPNFRDKIQKNITEGGGIGMFHTILGLS